MESLAFSITLVLIGSFISSFAPILIKKGTFKLSFHPMKFIKNYKIMAGLFLYVFGTLIYIPALKGGDLSLLYPLVSTSFIWVCLFSVKFLNEKMNSMKWIGISIIIIGIGFIGLGG